MSDRRGTVLSLVAVLLVLGVLNVGDHFISGSSLWVGPPLAVALLLFARFRGLSWAELGLARDRLTVGAVWGGCAIALVAVVYLIGVLLPGTRSAFLDDRYHVSVGRAFYVAFVQIPLGTVLLEEVAFRSVLWGLLGRLTTVWRVLITTSVLFGIWHVVPSLNLSTSNAGVQDIVGSGGAAKVLSILGAVALTTIGGLAFGEMRRRSDSLLASIGAHWATNGIGVLFGILAWQLAGG